MEGLPDLGAMLTPIEGDSTAGSDLRLDESPTAAIRNLRDARKAATQAERRLEGAEDGADMPMVPEWEMIAAQAPDLIATRSKDLELAAWLTEAWLRTNNEPPLSGLALGFRLMAGLVRDFWPETFPPPEDGDDYEKVRAIAQLNGESGEGTLFAPLRRLTITRATGGESYALWQYENAYALAQRPTEQREKRIAEGALTVETIQQSANMSPQPFFVALLGGVEEARTALSELDTVMTEKCGSTAPSLGRLRDFLEELSNTVKMLGQHVLPVEGEDAPAEAGGDTVAGESGGSAGAGGGSANFSLTSGDAAKNREAALRVLEQIADFFRRTEPHSPVSYTLQDVVRRARLPLPELMAELLGDDGTRRQFFANAGYKLPDESSEY